MLCRLGGGTGWEDVPLQDLQPACEFTFLAYQMVTVVDSRNFATLVGGAECTRRAGGAVFYVDGCGSLEGSGGGASLVHSMFQFARQVQTRCILLKAKAGSEGFWFRSGLRPLHAAWRTKRRAAGSDERRRAEEALLQDRVEI